MHQVSTTESLWVGVALRLHQGSALIPFLFAVVMDRLTDEVRQAFPWTMLFADCTIVLVVVVVVAAAAAAAVAVCRESRVNPLDRWRYALGR